MDTDGRRVRGRLQTFQCFSGSLVAQVARIERRRRLEQEDVNLVRSDGLVFNSARNDEEVTLVELDYPVAKVNGQMAVEDEKEFVLGLVMVPDELALEFRKLYVLAVQLANNPRAPVLLDLLELLAEVHFSGMAIFHARPPN